LGHVGMVIPEEFLYNFIGMAIGHEIQLIGKMNFSIKSLRKNHLTKAISGWSGKSSKNTFIL
jgi:hypothetical protein